MISATRSDLPVRSWPEPALLAVALSGRALAQAVRRAGYAPLVIDLFGDADMRAAAASSVVVAGSLAYGFDAEDLLAAAEVIAPKGTVAGFVYGSGLEAQPELISALAEGRPLFGNSAATVAALKSPTEFFALLNSMGLPYPEIQLDPPLEPTGWLAKRIGGAGGAHVLPAAQAAGRSFYWQRLIAGRVVAALVVADGRQGRLLGFSAQWAAATATAPFRFGGAIAPASVPEAMARAIGAALDPLVQKSGLKGLASIDCVFAEDGSFTVLEVNPRPGASLELFDGEGEGSLISLHLAACCGVLDHPYKPPSLAKAMAVVYADRLLAVPYVPSWPEWVHDRPRPGARLEGGAPVCTVTAAAADPLEAEALVRERARWVLAQLGGKEGG